MLLASPTREDGLTDRQHEVLSLLCRPGAQPTIREIGDAMGITSPNGVSCHLRILARKGWIRHAGNRARSIAILRRPAIPGVMPDDVRSWLEPRLSPGLMAAIDAELSRA